MSAPIRLFVGNLPDKVNENDLRSAFSKFGEITALDIKSKPTVESEKKLFAFVTLTGSNNAIESCIQYFANKDFNGSRLYVTRARESFLERLQREREQAQRKEVETNEPPNTQVTPKPLNINIHSHKRKYDVQNSLRENGYDKKPKNKFEKEHHKAMPEMNIGDSLFNSTNSYSGDGSKNFDKDDKKQNADKKRLDSMKKKRQEFNEKKMIIKSGLIGIDKAANKKVIFSDDVDEETSYQNNLLNNKNINKDCNKKKKTLFDEEDDKDDNVNFEIKKQFEGKKGQKVLDLQSRYKADKRFILDERFIEDDKSDDEPDQQDKNEIVELGHDDEKYKQLNILQDVLGIPIKIKQTQDVTKQNKSKLGMLRFDPTQPEHAKFLAPVESIQEQSTKLKKNKAKETLEAEVVQEEPIKIEKVEVSKEQFYKVTDTLKETLEQPNSFSLRSLFGKETDTDLNEEMTNKNDQQDIKKVVKEKKIRNPLDPGDKNPFVYDSSESENEEDKVEQDIELQTTTAKSVWRENLFFSESDERLKDGLSFFTQSNVARVQKDRRELKSVMKKRVYNKERKNKMFQRKIGGRRKTAKKSFRKKS